MAKEEKFDPILESNKKILTESFNSQALVLTLTMQLDKLRSNYVDLEQVTKDVVFTNDKGVLFLLPQVSKLIDGSTSRNLDLICRTSRTAEEVQQKLIESKLINLDRDEPTQ